MYTIETRARLVELLSAGSLKVNETDTAEIRKEIDGIIGRDAFIAEQAGKLIAWKELQDPESYFATCASSGEVQKCEAEILERITHSKTAVAALRRNIKDWRIVFVVCFYVPYCSCFFGGHHHIVYSLQVVAPVGDSL